MYPITGGLDRITIPPGRTMKVIATVIGTLAKYIGNIYKLVFYAVGIISQNRWIQNWNVPGSFLKLPGTE